MDHSKILRQAWHLVKSYRALWVFGVILALTTISWETAIFLNHDDNVEENQRGIVVTRMDGETFSQALQRTLREEVNALGDALDKVSQGLEEFYAEELHIETESDILAIITMLVATMLIGYTVAKIASYVADTALIRMVDETEDSGVRHSVRQGFRMGWSRTAGRFFLIDVLVDVSAVAIFILLFALLLAPLALWATGSTPAGVVGTIITAGLFFPGIALVIFASATLSMLKKFFRRACALEELGVRASIRRGYALARQHPREVIPVWLVAVAVNLAWPLLMISVVILLVGVGVVVGGLPALLVGALSGLAFDGATPLILASVVGIFIFILALAVPLLFLGGLREVFLSSTWTLTYRELRAVENLEPRHVPDMGTSGLESAAAA